MDLSGKKALVTGGGSGIGLGIALALAQEGCRVVLAGRNEAKLREAAARCAGAAPVLVHACDVSKRGEVVELFDWLQRQGFDPLDLLVNSAGINIPKRKMADLDPADWDRVMAINATGAFNAMHAALPGMRRQRDGLIVNISSVAGKRALAIAGPAYCASKFAMTALGTAVGQEEQVNGIRVTNVYPGEVDTPILDQRPVPVPAERRAQMVHPEDIAACVVAIARLPRHVHVPELLIKPLYQDYL
jgi:NAD(P)-dependent dehydrogenase (short-subunit alcohol dehydrogenase family)